MAKATKTKKSSYKNLENDYDKRKEIGQLLVTMIDAGIAEKGTLPERWDKNEGYYNNDNSVLPRSEAIPDADMMVFPLVQPRIDSISDVVVSTITNASPFLIGKRRGTAERNERTENVVQFFFNIGGLKGALESISPCVGCTNAGIIRQTFQTAHRDFLPARPTGVEPVKTGEIIFAGLVYDTVHPKNFVIYPAAVKGIESAQLVGHKFTILRQELDEMVAAGRYYEYKDAEIVGAANNSEELGRSDSFARVEAVTTGEKEHEEIDVYSVIFKYDYDGSGHQSYYEATVSYADQCVLRMRPYGYSRPHYFDFRWKPRQYGNWWPSTSVAQDLQGLQWQYCNLNNIAVYGAWFSALPTLVSNGLFEKTQRIKAGSVVSANGAELTPVNTQFNVGTLFPLVQNIENMADSACGMSRAGIAMASSVEKTATQQMSEDAGQGNRIGGYVRRYGDSLADMASLAQEQLYANYAMWNNLYANEVEIDSADELIAPMQWQLQNQNPAISPMQRITQMQMLSQVAAADQEKVLQGVMQMLSELLSQMVQDPGVADQILQTFEAKVRQLQAEGLNMREIVRTMVYSMDLPNAEKILNEYDENVNGNEGQMGQPISDGGVEGVQGHPLQVPGVPGADGQGG